VTNDDTLAADADAEDRPSDLELAVRWARQPAPGPVRRDTLPASARDALDDAVSDIAGHHAVVLALRTVLDGAETARVGPVGPLPPDDELIVVSVVTSEVRTSAVHVIAHTVVAHLVPD
jgi:hypothetical protein